MLYIYNPGIQEVEAPLRVHIQDQSVLHSKMILSQHGVEMGEKEFKKL